MSPEQATILSSLPLPSENTRKQIVISTLLFCAASIVGVTVFGEPENSLHTSAQAWAFGTSILVIMGYVFGTVVDNYNTHVRPLLTTQNK